MLTPGYPDAQAIILAALQEQPSLRWQILHSMRKTIEVWPDGSLIGSTGWGARIREVPLLFDIASTPDKAIASVLRQARVMDHSGERKDYNVISLPRSPR